MSDTLKPPPYRPRLKEGEVDKEAKLTEDQLHGRDVAIRNIVVTMAVGIYAGLVFLLRELPGGGGPYVFFLGLVPSMAYWVVVLILTMVYLARTDARARIRDLLVVLTALALASAACSAIRYENDPVGWHQDLDRKFF